LNCSGPLFLDAPREDICNLKTAELFQTIFSLKDKVGTFPGMKDATADEDGFQEIRKRTKALGQSAKPAAKPRKGCASAPLNHTRSSSPLPAESEQSL